MHSRSYDAVVLGVGGMGSATLLHLARRGLSVLGIERFDIPHAMGSSHGVTRIIRKAYFEHPSYVPLLLRAFELWNELETESGEHLLHVTGSLDIGPSESTMVEGSLGSCVLHHLEHELLDAGELQRRYPGYTVPDHFRAVYQPDGGFLLSEQCIVAHCLQAMQSGAEIHGREQVLQWRVRGKEVEIHTDRATYSTPRLIVTAGSWSAKILPPLERFAVPERQVLGWFQPTQPELYTPDRFPVFNIMVDEGHYYGFPIYGVPGFKLGRYHHRSEVVDPDQMDRDVHREDETVLRDCVARYFPQALGPILSLKPCLFTNTPDEHFVLDRHPDHPSITIGAGFSGHGFKFASVIGEILADLATAGSTRHDISLFSLNRFEKQRGG